MKKILIAVGLTVLVAIVLDTLMVVTMHPTMNPHLRTFLCVVVTVVLAPREFDIITQVKQYLRSK